MYLLQWFSHGTAQWVRFVQNPHKGWMFLQGLPVSCDGSPERLVRGWGDCHEFKMPWYLPALPLGSAFLLQVGAVKGLRGQHSLALRESDRPRLGGKSRSHKCNFSLKSLSRTSPSKRAVAVWAKAWGSRGSGQEFASLTLQDVAVPHSQFQLGSTRV